MKRPGLSRTRKLVILLALALACRALWWITRVEVVENEGTEYARIAETWFGGEGYLGLLGGPEIQFPPAYPALIGIANLALHDLVLSGRLISLVAGLASVGLIYCIVETIFDERAALVAGVLWALHPVLVGLSVTVFSESLALCSILLATMLALRAMQNGRLLDAVGAGATSGAAYLVRPELLLFAPIFALFPALRSYHRERRIGRAFLLAATTLVAAGTVAAPEVTRLSALSGSFRWEGKTPGNELINERIDAGMSQREAARGLDVESDFARAAPYLGGPDLWPDQSSFIRGRNRRTPSGTTYWLRALPMRVGRSAKFAVKQLREWTSVARVPVGLIALAAGIFGFPWRRGRRRLEASMLLTALALQCAVLLGIRFYFVRFVFPLLAMTLPWMASGLDRLIVAALSLSAKFRSHGSAHLATAGALLLAAALCVSSHPRVAAASEFAESSDAPLKAGGSWIHVHPRVNERRRRPVVMGYSAVLSFYADATLSYLPYTEDEARALRYVHWISPDYIVLRPEDVAQSPYIAHWLQSGVPDSCAHLAHTTPEDRGPLVIYEWTCPTS